MAVAEKIIVYQGINLDLHETLIQNNIARFIKNLVYEITDTSGDTVSKGAKTGVMKTMESVRPYLDGFVLPDGYNQAIGTFAFKELKQVLVMVYNDRQNHTIYRINCKDRTSDIVYQGATLNFQLDPKFFIHTGGCTIKMIRETNPETGEEVIRSFAFITDAYNYQRHICLEDAIATGGFNPTLFPYFQGGYDPMILINMGLPTPNECISFSEIPLTESTVQKNNTLLYNAWQWRIKGTDVWGRPSEHGIISDLYIPGVNDCINGSDNLPRCVKLQVKIDLPILDKIDIEYRNCNNDQWYIEETLDLYVGSNIGQWWLRQRNPDVDYNTETKILTYTFCRDKECRVVPVTETTRLYNPLPKKSVSVAPVGKFIGLGNNTERFNPFAKSILDGIKVSVEQPAQTDTNTATITIYAPIWNQYLKNFQMVRKRDDGIFIWGDNNDKHGGAVAYSQIFGGVNQQGFPGYLVGNPNLVFSTQVYVDANGQLVDDPTLDGINLSPTHMTFQKWVFTNIPRGKYIFRLASHLVDTAINTDYQRTSTTVWGSVPYYGDYSYNALLSQSQNRKTVQELEIDVCNGDYDSFKVGNPYLLFILDNAGFANGQQSRAKCGYFYGTNKNGFNEEPIELMNQTYVNGYGSNITDHNGFYYYVTQGNGRHFVMNFQYKCKNASIQLEQKAGQGMAFEDIIVDKFNNGQFADYTTVGCNRTLVKGRVTLDNPAIGIAGIPVAITRGQVTTTDSDGYFTLIVHDDALSCTRNDRLYIMSKGCSYTENGSSCLQPKNVSIFCCINCADRILDNNNWTLSTISKKGLLSGGTYPNGITGFDWSGRATFIQPLRDIQIPSVIETKSISPSLVKVSIAPTVLFPSEIAYITFWIGEESTIDDYLSWIVDDVKFVDNTGQENDTSPSQIKIYYGSILEYAKQNNYNTTTAWDFLSTNSANPRVSDTVQFLINGDGKFFDTTIISLVKYDKDGKYILIDYNKSLKDLKKNALIRLVRPKTCVEDSLYYEVCSKIDIKNGQPLITEFYLNAFDTYYLNRSIPVPVTSGSPPATINELRTFGFQFEHDSPSNFWGQGCKNIGRVNAKNPYEAELHLPDQIALSGALSDTGQLNFLNYFDDAKKADFSDARLNGIISIITELSTVLLIGQSNTMVTGFDDNLIRTNSDGTISTTAIPNNFGRPQMKIGYNYGCLQQDKNSIIRFEGRIQFVDSTKGSVVQHDFQSVDSVSNNVVDSYVRPKIKYVQKYNNENTNKKFFVGGINPVNYGYILTDYTLNSNDFFNELRYIDISRNDTIEFDTRGKLWKGFWSFTPENYSYCEGDVEDVQMFSFLNGIPYYHYSAFNETDYGVVYGKEVDKTIRVISVIDGFRKKKPLALSVLCKESQYFVPTAVTETNQETRMLLGQWLQASYGWYAPFLCSLNTPFDPNRPEQTGSNKLMDGDMLIGNYIDVTLVGDVNKNTIYSELQGFIISVFGDANNLTNNSQTTNNGG